MAKGASHFPFFKLTCQLVKNFLVYRTEKIPATLTLITIKVSDLLLKEISWGR
jgi:hypothetical protein